MSCHAQIVKRKAPFWCGAAFLLSLSDGAAAPNSYWVALTSPILLWSGAALLIFLLRGGAAFPPPSGWCWFSHLLNVFFFWNYGYTKIRSKTARKDAKERGEREGEGAKPPERRRVRQHHPVRIGAPPNRKRGWKRHNLWKNRWDVHHHRHRWTETIAPHHRLHRAHCRPSPSSPPSLLGRNHRPAAPNQRRSEENSTTHTVREEEQHHSN